MEINSIVRCGQKKAVIQSNNAVILSLQSRREDPHLSTQLRAKMGICRTDCIGISK